MTEFAATYLCRNCRKRFAGGRTTNEKYALSITVSLAIQEAIAQPHGHMSRFDSHFCADGSVGFGDFVGFVIDKK